ncbi:M56 family metallopeptidase [Rhodanobacter geophilus]|uniref:M56 family metallopeptidase n=1 Tax=Rhodanobacter geophilus TaxID=3162488 RepID=A0ABV3QP11_9GAMM
MDWAARGWLAQLAFTAAVLLVAGLRRPCRRWFGAEHAFQLWLLPPLAMLASQLPHAATSSAPLPPLVYTITSVVGATASHADAAGGFDWRTAALLLWLAGIAVVLGSAVAVQLRYRERLRGAAPVTGVSASRPVLRATSAGVGPALVGAWRSRIVLPADFHQRYDTTEQALILAHEAAHARRGDGWWCLLAQAHVALLWCHPLAWWALAALRQDQELACDAAVLREHGAQRRSYANAMLKTQSAAFALPVGCTWSPRHPLTERIAMLGKHQPGKVRRACGSLVVLGMALALAGSVYATTQPGSSTAMATQEVSAQRYTLKLVLGFGGEPPRYHGTLCLKPGQFHDMIETNLGKLPQWQGRFTVVPAEHGQLEVQATMSGGPLARPANPRIRMLPGQQGTIQVGSKLADKDGKVVEDDTIRIDLTPSIGC